MPPKNKIPISLEQPTGKTKQPNIAQKMLQGQSRSPTPNPLLKLPHPVQRQLREVQNVRHCARPREHSHTFSEMQEGRVE
jgi:hypothetical protein